MDPMWKHPFSAIVAGPSGCGKTNFVTNFLNQLSYMCNTTFGEIHWYYDKYRPVNITLPVLFKEGLPDFEGSILPRLIIIDDLMRETNGRIVDLFTKGCHHGNISVIFISQNLFHQGRGQRDISLNAHYIVCFKNPRDKAQIRHLSHQVCPERPLFLQEAFTDATSAPYGYLLLDLKQDTPEDFRFRTNILQSDSVHYVYVPRK